MAFSTASRTLFVLEHEMGAFARPSLNSIKSGLDRRVIQILVSLLNGRVILPKLIVLLIVLLQAEDLLSVGHVDG